jgi:lipopolysaccharide transport system permease protein
MIQTDSTLIASGAGRCSDPLSDGDVGVKPADDGPEDLDETIIRPQTGWVGIDWREMWSHRELLGFLIKRDVSVRYKQTILGPAWAVLQPLIMMVIFSVIFGHFASIPPEGFPYPVFVFAGLIPWMLFSQGLSQSALSLVNQQQLLTKVYFPRLFIPVASACVFLVDLLISLTLYVPLLLYYGVTPSWGVIWLPPLILLTLAATLGFGLTLAALTVFYRDFKHIVPFLVQILMYVSPVIYPARLVGERDPRWGLVLSLNPMFGIIDAYRSAILGLPWHFSWLAISTASALGLLLFALFYFRRTERRFADFA